MHKIIGLIAAVAMVGGAGLANAADGQGKDVKEPTQLTGVEMEAVTAGVGSSTASRHGGQINLGSFKLVFNGTTWVRQSN